MYKNESVPAEVDIQIRKGIERAEKVKKSRKIRNFSVIAVLLVITVFIGTVNFSPAVANYLAEIPGMDVLISWIRAGHHVDKGLESAIKNGHLQHVNASVERNGITLTIEDLIIDRSGMIAICSIENNSHIEDKKLTIGGITIKDENGKFISTSSMLTGLGESQKSIVSCNFITNTKEGYPETVPDKLIFSAAIIVLPEEGTPYQLGDPLEVDLHLNNSNLKDLEKHINIDKSIEIGGQKIIFRKATIYPTKVTVDVLFDEKNTMNIFDIENIYLIDETGTEWVRKKSELYDLPAFIKESFGLNINERRLVFESPYFNEPKELSIKGDGIRAIDKNERVVIDIQNKRLIEAPDDNLKLLDMNFDGNELTLNFILDTPPKYYDVEYLKKLNHPLLFGLGKCYDADGRLISRLSTGGKQIGYYSYKYKFDKQPKGPISAELTDYPNSLEGKFEVKILE